MRIFYVRLLPTNDIVRFTLPVPVCSDQFTQKASVHHCVAEIDTYLSIMFRRNVRSSQANRLYNNNWKKGDANASGEGKSRNSEHDENIQPFYMARTKHTMNGAKSNEEDFLVYIFFSRSLTETRRLESLFWVQKMEPYEWCVCGRNSPADCGVCERWEEEHNRFLLLPQLFEGDIDRQFSSVRGQNTRTTPSSSPACERERWFRLFSAINGKNKNNRFEVMVRLDILLLRARTEEMKCHQNDTSFICAVPSLIHPTNL